MECCLCIFTLQKEQCVLFSSDHVWQMASIAFISKNKSVSINHHKINLIGIMTTHNEDLSFSQVCIKINLSIKDETRHRGGHIQKSNPAGAREKAIARDNELVR